MKFLKRFDKKRFFRNFRIIAIFFAIVLQINLIGIAYSRYESKVDSIAEADVALFIINAGTTSSTLTLGGLEPSYSDYTYDIYIANYDNDGNRTNVNMTYTVNFETTTNLPLTYKIIDKSTGQTVTSSTSLIQDDDGVYYNHYDVPGEFSFSFLEDQIREYQVIVTFPYQYVDNSDEYEGLIDLFIINVDAKQVV